MKYLSWNIQKQGATFSVACYPSEMNIGELHKSIPQTVLPLDWDFSRNVCLEKKSWLSIDDEYHVQVLVTKAGKDVKCHKKCPFWGCTGLLVPKWSLQCKLYSMQQRQPLDGCFDYFQRHAIRTVPWKSVSATGGPGELE